VVARHTPLVPSHPNSDHTSNNSQPHPLDRSASWMDKIVHFIPYASFLLFLYEVLDNPPPQHPYILDERLLVGFTVLTILLALPDLQRRPPSTPPAPTGGHTPLPITPAGSQAHWQTHPHAQQRRADNRLRCKGATFHGRSTTRGNPHSRRKESSGCSTALSMTRPRLWSSGLFSGWLGAQETTHLS
jgi:hypothetical protein